MTGVSADATVVGVIGVVIEYAFGTEFLKGVSVRSFGASAETNEAVDEIFGVVTS